MVWEGWALYRARQEALKRGDLKEAEELRKRSEEWSRTHSSDDPIGEDFEESIERRVTKIERRLHIK
jgi:hypothetical protein